MDDRLDDRLDELAVRLSDLARELQRQPDPAGVLEAVVAGALRLVPGAQEGSITRVLGRRKVRAQAGSSDLPRTVDALQEEVGEGPCLSAVFEHRTVRVDDMTTELRWPLFSARAAEHGVRSMLSFQLHVDGDDLGALNLYSRDPGSFGRDASVEVGLLVASHGALAYVAALREAALQRALGSREVVAQAQGILMERHRLSAEQAFAHLTVVSQDRNVKVLEVARRLVETGALEAG